MVTPVAKRQAVAHLCSSFEVSQRRACAVIGADRTSVRYRSVRPDDVVIRARLRELANIRRRFGYRRLLLLLRIDGVSINHKKLRRLYAEERLQVRRRGGRKKTLRTRAPMTLPQGPNHRWSLDFVSDVVRQPALPHVGRCGRLHPRVHRIGCRYVALGHKGRPRARCGDRPAWSPTNDRQRQWYRIYQHGYLAMVTAEQDRMALHRTRQAAAERIRRKLQWAPARRTPERDVVLVPQPCPRSPCRMAGRLQHRPPAQRDRQSSTGTYAKLNATDMQRDGTHELIWGSAPRPVASSSHTGSNDQRILPIAG